MAQTGMPFSKAVRIYKKSFLSHQKEFLEIKKTQNKEKALNEFYKVKAPAKPKSIAKKL